MKLAFIGCGNMVQAMILGLLKHVDSSTIMASNRSSDKLLSFKAKTNIQTGSNKEAAQFGDYLFIGVKPSQIMDVLEEIKDFVKPHTTIVSLAAGITLEQLETKIKGRVVRMMPNTPIQVGEATIALVSKDKDDQLKLILSDLGQVFWIEEDMMSAFIGIAGSSPAYFFMMMEAMGDGAVRHGIPRDMAYQMVCQTMLGSAKLYLDTLQHPGVLKDKVTSLRGTTIEAVASLERNGLRSTLIEAVDVVVKKDRGM